MTSEPIAMHPDVAKTFKPLLVPNAIARKLIGVGNTKFWELVKSGQIELVTVGRRRMTVYESIEKLANSNARGA